MRPIQVAALLGAACLAAGSSPALSQDRVSVEQLTGVWNFRSGVVHDVAKNIDIPMQLTSGVLTFAPVGGKARIIVLMAKGDRMVATLGTTDAEVARRFKAFSAYSGMVEIGTNVTDEGTEVVNTIDYSLRPVMPNRVRFYRIEGATLYASGTYPDGAVETTIWDKAQ